MPAGAPYLRRTLLGFHTGRTTTICGRISASSEGMGPAALGALAGLGGSISTFHAVAAHDDELGPWCVRGRLARAIGHALEAVRHDLGELEHFAVGPGSD